MQPTTLAELSNTRREILRILKDEGHATIPRLASALHLAHETVRQQIGDLSHRGWVTSHCIVDDASALSGTGRPAVDYCLTPAGDHFFPKNYDGFIVQMLDVIEKSEGTDAALQLAAAITDDRVAKLHDRVDGVSLREKIDAMRALYWEGDPFIHVERHDHEVVLVEKCCPYLNVALERPIICSTTVSTLRRLLGYEVVRERRFQDGDARCEFHIKLDKPNSVNSPRFKIEPPRAQPA